MTCDANFVSHVFFNRIIRSIFQLCVFLFSFFPLSSPYCHKNRFSCLGIWVFYPSFSFDNVMGSIFWVVILFLISSFFSIFYILSIVPMKCYVGFVSFFTYPVKTFHESFSLPHKVIENILFPLFLLFFFYFLPIVSWEGPSESRFYLFIGFMERFL